MVSWSTGKDVSFLINCKFRPTDDWAAFACWHSLHLMFPEANIAIACDRREFKGRTAFQWATRLNVPFFYHQKPDTTTLVDSVVQASVLTFPCFVVDPYYIAVRPIDPDIMVKLDAVDGVTFSEGVRFFTKADYGTGEVSEIKGLSALCTEQGMDATFVGYGDSCGRFILRNWLEIPEVAPFGSIADLTSNVQLTANERKVFQLWKDTHAFYERMR